MASEASTSTATEAEVVHGVMTTAGASPPSPRAASSYSQVRRDLG